MKNEWIAALGKMAHGIYVLTTWHGDEINGMIASWVCQVSYDPPLVAVAVHPARYSHKLIEKSGVFALHMLEKDQSMLLRRFKGDDPAAKFEGLDWQRGRTGCPLLSVCTAFLECRVRQTFVPGNHSLFIGEIVHGARISDGPVLTTADYSGQYLGKA
jgi:flavin reductase (DIM6/NTAB) family NADH-FMN oxidoreductase RutF